MHTKNLVLDKVVKNMVGKGIFHQLIKVKLWIITIKIIKLSSCFVLLSKYKWVLNKTKPTTQSSKSAKIIMKIMQSCPYKFFSYNSKIIYNLEIIKKEYV